MLNRFNLPESFEENFEHYHLPDGLKNLGIMSDLHIPYHSIRAISEAFEYFLIKGIDSVLLNGDVLDCYQLSCYNPDPRKRNFANEILAFQQFIRSIKEVFPGKPIYYKIGNHEERYERIMITRCPEFLNIDKFDFENVLGCHDLGINVIKDRRRVYAGKLPIFHGHEVRLKYAAVNPARSLFLKTKFNALCSHLHRTSLHTEPSIHEEIVCYSTGHLGDPHPYYAPENNWNHGCARVEKNEAGDFEVINFALKQNRLFAVTA